LLPIILIPVTGNVRIQVPVGSGLLVNDLDPNTGNNTELPVIAFNPNTQILESFDLMIVVLASNNYC
jgi:hypothetical protein